MDSFAQAAGIDMNNLSYIIIPLLVVTTSIVIVIGLVDMLRVLRSGCLYETDFISGIFKAVGAIVAVVALVYFVQ